MKRRKLTQEKIDAINRKRGAFDPKDAEGTIAGWPEDRRAKLDETGRVETVKEQ